MFAACSLPIVAVQPTVFGLYGPGMRKTVVGITGGICKCLGADLGKLEQRLELLNILGRNRDLEVSHLEISFEWWHDDVQIQKAVFLKVASLTAEVLIQPTQTTHPRNREVGMRGELLWFP